MSRYTTFRLFASPSFLGGMARVLDIGGTLEIYNESRTPAEADTLALRNDWGMVGDDILYAIERYEQQRATTTTIR